MALVLGLVILDKALHLNQLNIEPGEGAARSTSQYAKTDKQIYCSTGRSGNNSDYPLL